MPVLLALPDNYSYVIAAATSSLFVNTLHFFIDVNARKRSGLNYPIMSASEELAAKDPEAYRFNCTQRAHTNFTENHTSFLVALGVAGLRFPTVAASLGILWTLARAHYALGYTGKSGPQGRILGSAINLTTAFGLQLTAAFTAITMCLSQ